MRFNSLAVVALLTASGVVAQSASASVLITGTSATASSHSSGGLSGDNGNPNLAVNGVGLSATGSHDFGDDNSGWLSGFYSDPTPFFTVDLGALYAVDSSKIWNFNSTQSGRGSKAVGIYYTSSSAIFSASTRGVTGWTFLEDVTLAEAPGGTAGGPPDYTQSGPDYFGQNFSFSSFDAQYIRFAITSNYGNPGSTGLSEVQFFGTAAGGGAVPEPASLAVISLGSLLMLKRRRA